MTDNVIQFGKPAAAEPISDRVVWRCNCGCLTFFVRADRELECAVCGTVAEGAGEWRTREPEAPAGAAPDVSPGDVRVTDLNSPELAIRRMVKKIDVENLVSLVVLNADGSLSAWGKAETEAQAQWILDRLLDAHALMVKS